MTAMPLPLLEITDAEEAPLCATGALAHALATRRGRFGPASEDLADAAYARVLLQEARWDVQKGIGKATERERAAALAGAIERVENHKRFAAERDRREEGARRALSPDELRGVARDTAKPLSAADVAAMDAIVVELRSLGFDLGEVG